MPISWVSTKPPGKGGSLRALRAREGGVSSSLPSLFNDSEVNAMEHDGPAISTTTDAPRGFASREPTTTPKTTEGPRLGFPESAMDRVQTTDRPNKQTR